MEGLRLSPIELGRGSFGVVLEGRYRGAPCAVKILTSQGLDRTALREVLLGPSLVHPNVVPTYASRCARLTHELFDLLEGNDRRHALNPEEPRVLLPAPLISGDGFGDPTGLRDGVDPLIMLHKVLFELKAMVGQVVVVLVQEYCSKGTLAEAIHRGSFAPRGGWTERLACRALLRTAAEMARGLLHLHDAGVVHGDLKPANVLLQSSRGDRRGFEARVADFGLSYVLPGTASSMSADGWGSVAYMAPELFDGKVSRAVDVWAFGVCLWEMLTRKLPYRGLSRQEVISGVMSGTVSLPWPSNQEAPMAAPIVALGRRCLSHSPADRPSFLQVVDDLVRIEKDIRAAALAANQGPHEQREQQQGERNLRQEEGEVQLPPAAAAAEAASTPEGMEPCAPQPRPRDPARQHHHRRQHPQQQQRRAVVSVAAAVATAEPRARAGQQGPVLAAEAGPEAPPPAAAADAAGPGGGDRWAVETLAFAGSPSAQPAGGHEHGEERDLLLIDSNPGLRLLGTSDLEEAAAGAEQREQREQQLRQGRVHLVRPYSGGAEGITVMCI